MGYFRALRDEKINCALLAFLIIYLFIFKPLILEISWFYIFELF